jgi:hypothetical protein
MDSGKLQPALLGGVFIGVLSALPIISAGNCCCCLWVLAGGVLAVYLRQQNSPVAVEAAEGALLGLIAGFIGGLIAALLSIPIQMMMGPMMAEWITSFMERMNEGSGQELPPDFRNQIEQMARGGAGAGFVFALVSTVIYAIFGMLGGLLGVAIFKKSAPPPPPPPPPTVVVHDPGIAQ